MPFFSRKYPDVCCHVYLLDNSNFIVKCKGSETGGFILHRVLQHLNVTEPDYFGLRFQQADTSWVWLSLKKSLYPQLKHSHSSRRFVTFGELAFTLYFGVKFYPSDPCRIDNENCRLQVFLQTRRDLCSNRVRVPTDLRPLLCGLCLQSDLGDYNSTLGTGYVKRSSDLPTLSGPIEEQAIEFAHRDLSGVTPAEAERQFLEHIKWMPSYGMTSYRVKDGRGVNCVLGITPMGLIVERATRNDSSMEREEIFWPRIHNIIQKKTALHVHVRAHERSETIYIFKVDNKNEAHVLWKLCVEHQVFFRCERDSSFQPSVLNQRERELRLPRSSRRRVIDAEFVPTETASVDYRAVNRLSAPDLFNDIARSRASRTTKATHTGGYHSDTTIIGGVMNSTPNSANSSWSDVTSVRQHVGDFSKTDLPLKPPPPAAPRAPNRSNEFRQSAFSAFRQVSPSSSSRGASGTSYVPPSAPFNEGDSIRFAHSQRRSEAAGTGAVEQRRLESINNRLTGRRALCGELFEHIKFEHVNPQHVGLSEQDIRNIPFTKVETKDVPFRVRYSPNSGKARGRFAPHRTLPPTEILKQSSEPVSDAGATLPSEVAGSLSQQQQQQQQLKGCVSPSAPNYSSDLRATLGNLYRTRLSAVSSALPRPSEPSERSKPAFLASVADSHCRAYNDYSTSKISTTTSMEVTRRFVHAQAV